MPLLCNVLLHFKLGIAGQTYMFKKIIYLSVLLLISFPIYKVPKSFTLRVYAQQNDKSKYVVFVVNKTNTTSTLSFNELRKILLGRQNTWPDGKKVTLVTRDRGDEDRNLILKKIYKMTDNDFDEYFLKASFKGEINSIPKILSTSNGVKRFIFNVPGAIGYIKLSDVDDTIKVLKIDNSLPGENNYKFLID